MWLSFPYPTCITWGMVHQGDMLWNFNPCDMWFLNSLEHNATKLCYSAMPTRGVTCLPQCLALSNGSNVLNVFHATNTFVALIWDPTRLITNSQNMACLEHLTADVGPRTVVIPLSVKPENGFPPRPIVFEIYTNNTACFVPAFKTCIDGRCFHKDAKLPDPTTWGWEWHDRTKAWVPYSTELPDASRVAVCCYSVDVRLSC